MLSRVAEAIYWTHRYVERAESVARFVDASLHLSLDLANADAGQWGALIATTGDDAVFRARHGEPDRESVLAFLTFDRTYPSSVIACLQKARENARSVREVISSEMWEALNKAHRMVGEASRSPVPMETPHSFYAAVKESAQTFVGATELTMTHDEAWHFGRLGRLLERADKTSRILDVKSYLLLPTQKEGVVAAYDETQWAALLRSASALEMYRRRHGLIAPENVVDFLMLERSFPRSVLHCLAKSERSLRAITGSPLGTSGNAAERALGRLRARFEYAVTSEIIAHGVHGYVDELQRELNDLADAIGGTFFAPPADAHVVVGPPPDSGQPEEQQRQQQQ